MNLDLVISFFLILYILFPFILQSVLFSGIYRLRSKDNWGSGKDSSCTSEPFLYVLVSLILPVSLGSF